jgi:exodeoxyribonuclease V gamma subunit
VLYLHRSERADGLVAMLGDLLAQPAGDAFDREVVAVPTRGIERWLSQQLSTRLGAGPGRGDGVCANVEFPFPGALVTRVSAAASGIDPEADPWRTERAVWPLLEVVDASAGEAWMEGLSAHLGAAAPAGDGRRFATVRHLADLFDRYGVHRPDMVQAWARGQGGGTGRASRWQVELWRRLRDHVGVPSPAERLTATLERLRSEPELADLPERLSLFGLTALPAAQLEVLGALAAERDVHLFLLHPSPALWGRIETTPVGPRRRSQDETAELVEHPLVASWGRDAREMQLVLRASGHVGHEEHRPAPPPGTTLLGALQEAVRADRAPGARDPAAMAAGDRSVQVHSCHGRARQVEVLRDCVLHLLADDPELEPRDVVVLCPDIETYAPLIHAVFGTADAEGAAPERAGTPAGSELRVRLADRSLRQANPVLSVVAQLLELATARVTATEVLDLAGRDPVRRRFDLDDDDLGRIQQWVVRSGVRWGLDATHRRPFGLGDLGANTWGAGLDRMLLGVTTKESGERLFGGVLALDGVDSADIDLLGRFAELVDRLRWVVDALAGTRPLLEWVDVLAECARRLIATAERDAWQDLGLQRLLDELVDEATGPDGPSPARLGVGDLRALVEDRLRGRPSRASFRTGHLTVCTLVPMRSVPHRVVCLLGLDDGAFPRSTARDGDDLIAADPEVGDRDPRSEDRQLLLDALLAAQDHLIVTFTGRDERTNLARPPAVPVGELLDVIDRTMVAPDGAAARTRVLVAHPLQPFDARNFEPGGLGRPGPWSFDPVQLEGAQALRRPRRPPPPFLDAPLDEEDLAVVDLAVLGRFLRHPVAAFLERRLGIRPAARLERVADAIPTDLDPLASWALGERLVAAAAAGVPPGVSAAAERVRGVLPPGALGDGALDNALGEAAAVVAAAELEAPPTTADVAVELADGTRVVGTVGGLRGDRLVRTTFSHLGAPQRLAAWVDLVALSAAEPEPPLRAVIVGRRRAGGPPGADVTRSDLGPLGETAEERSRRALEALASLVELLRRGLREPLPLYCRTSAAWAQGTAARRRRMAEEQWQSTYGIPREDRDAAHRLVLGGTVGFEALLGEPPGADESGPGWAEAETSRFGRYAQRLWGPLLAHERLVDQ